MTWLFVATGFTGALTLVYLFRSVRALFAAPPAVKASFGPAGQCTDDLVRAVSGARREVHVLASRLACRPLAQALVDARLRGARVDVVLDARAAEVAGSDLPWLLEQGLAPRLDDQRDLAPGLVVLLDGRTALFAALGEAEGGEGLVCVNGHPELAAAVRREVDAHQAHARAADAGKAPAPPAEEKPKAEAPPAPAAKEPAPPASPPPVPAAADAALQRVLGRSNLLGLLEAPGEEGEEEEEEESKAAPPAKREPAASPGKAA